MKIILVQSKFLVKFCLIFFVTNISNIDRHSSIHQNKASWWIVCVKYLQNSQILIITKGKKILDSELILDFTTAMST